MPPVIGKIPGSNINTPTGVSTSGAAIVVPEMVAIGRDDIPTGEEVYAQGFFGNVNNTLLDLWEVGGTYTYPSLAGQQMQLVSTNAQDSSSGTGVRTVHFHYLDINYREQLEIVTLSGTTPVLTVATNIIRINKFHSLTTGTFGGGAAGSISVQSVGGATTFAQMNTPFNVELQALYTVPVTLFNGTSVSNFFMTRFNCSSGTASGTHYTRFFLRASADQFEPDDGLFLSGVFLIENVIGTLNSGDYIDFPVPIKVKPKTDIKISVISDAANATAICSGHFQGYLL